jgi:hypothetical protein
LRLEVPRYWPRRFIFSSLRHRLQNAFFLSSPPLSSSASSSFHFQSLQKSAQNVLEFIDFLKKIYICFEKVKRAGTSSEDGERRSQRGGGKCFAISMYVLMFLRNLSIDYGRVEMGGEDDGNEN